MQYEFHAPTLEEAIRLATQDISRKNTDDCGKLLKEIITYQGMVSDALRVLETYTNDTKREIERRQKEALAAGATLAFDAALILAGLGQMRIAITAARAAVGIDTVIFAGGGAITFYGLLSTTDDVASKLSTIGEYLSLSRKFSFARFQVQQGQKRLRSLQKRYKKAGCYISL